MKSLPLVSLLFLLLAPLLLAGQLTLRVVQIPANTPPETTLYVGGSFNGWDPFSPDYALTEDPEGIYAISLDLAPGTYEFKFTRGGWPTVEGSSEGNFIPNRSVTYNGGVQTEDLIIAGWEDIGGGNSTAAPNVSILTDSFYLPELDRYRRIWVYLPPDYTTSDKDYPVLYMHDGQNLFDNTTSFAGEWEVDESLNMLFAQGDEGIIVIGIDNGGIDRLAEYTPWPNPDYGGGQGDAYVESLVNDLKPYVDENYRTHTDAAHTGIMGSSLGGLISLYATIKHQDIFGRAGVFSPSLWFTDDIYDYVSTVGKQEDVRIYLLTGEQEGNSPDEVVADLLAMHTTLLDAGFGDDELFLITHPDGTHSEWYWAREFPAAYEWLFSTTTRVQSSAALAPVQIWPNPAGDHLYLRQLPVTSDNWQVSLFNPTGLLIDQQQLTENHLSVASLQPGTYFVVLSHPNGQWGVFRFIKQ